MSKRFERFSSCSILAYQKKPLEMVSLISSKPYIEVLPSALSDDALQSYVRR
jgi:hypothetical protein